MQPLKTYDYLVLARRRVFDWVCPLSAEQYTRDLSVALGSLARTLTHIMTSEWYYIQRMQGREVPPYEQWRFRHEDPPPFAVLEAAWTEEEGRTRAALGAINDWTAEIEYRVEGDDGPAIVTASPADIFTQLVLHEVHHRAQAMVFLRQLGVAVGDIDYNTMTYKRRKVGP